MVSTEISGRSLNEYGLSVDSARLVYVSLTWVLSQFGLLIQTVSHCWLDRRVRTSDWLSREADWRKWDTFNELIVAGGLCNMCK